MSFTDLGKATGLSTSAVHQRVRRLEQRGVIKGYSAVVDFDAIGLSLTAFVSVTPLDPPAPPPRPPRIPAATPGGPARDRGVPLRRRQRELHPQGSGGDAGRARRPA